MVGSRRIRTLLLARSPVVGNVKYAWLSNRGQGLVAQLTAARIFLTRLDRPDKALKLYEAASSSAVPHLDLEREIEAGIQEAKIILSQRASMVT